MKMEIGKFFMKEKGILWQITIYDGYQIDVSSFQSWWQYIKQCIKYIWFAHRRAIKVTPDNIDNILTQNANGMIQAHREYLENEGLDKDMFFREQPKLKKPTYIG